ncbi:phage major capsid protein [Mycolicibacterium hippocampi]|uniref:Major capsid protein n=1 Tax=Mycolicibacterium hippocampi TaxID=659824 RepID=A0A7I9ZVF7_9MYCO|nr:phage major capsid protein [Mycolicibacterium hippocampi]GFH05032.1 major capsid protein [Mycolicibacterium hippocampi]
MKFSKQELRAMSREQVVEHLAETDVKLSRLASKHRLSEADEEALDELRADHRAFEGQLGRIRFEEARATGDPGFATIGEQGTHRLDGSPVPGYESITRQDEPVDALTGLRSRAMRQLDESVKRGTLAARSAETVERMLDNGNGMERSWVSRYVAESGSDAYRNAFAKVVAFGEASAALKFTPAERDAMQKVSQLQGERALSLTDSAGGYLVPFELDAAVNLTGDGSVSPILQIARVIPTVTDVLHLVNSAGAEAHWYAEAEQVSDDSPSLSEPTVVNHRMSAWAPFSREVGMDAPTMLSEVSKVLQDAALQLLNEALINGTGTGQPHGVLDALTGTAADNDTAGAAFASADVYSTQAALAPRFQPNASWIANLAVINAIRQFESSNGARLFSEASANPPQLLGRNLYEASNMSGAMTTGEEVLIYGDFTQMVVSQRIGSTIELIPHIMGTNNRPTYQSGLFLVGRWGATVLTPNAFELLRVQ